MASHGAQDKDGTGRLSRGPVSLGAVVPRLARPAFRRMPPAAAQILTDWTAIAGPEFARLAVPRALSRGTLTLACPGPAALELSMLAPALIARINGALGRVAVERLRFVQGPLPDAEAPAAPAPPGDPPPAVARRIAGVDSPELREALARLAAGLYRGGDRR